MSSFLELVNKSRRECGVSGSALVTLQSGLSMEGERFKDWVNEAWREVQMHKPDWEWMRAETTFDTVVGQGEYTPTQAEAPLAAEWKRDSFRCYVDGDFGTEQRLLWTDYREFRDLYLFGTSRTQQSRPMLFSITPEKNLVLGPLPDAVYKVTGEYHRHPVMLEADTDSPLDYGLPEQYHMLIVYKAMLSYAFFEAAPEVERRAEIQTRRLMAKLEFDYLPLLESGPPLA